jgi:glycosyltransferase involved in cell wall biosynthesis
MYPSTWNEVTGIFVHEQVKELIKQGCEIKVVSAVPWAPFPMNKLKQKWRDYSRVPLKDTLEGVEIYRPRYLTVPRGNVLGISGYLMYRGIRKVIAEIYTAFEFDIIHAHTVFPDGVAGALLRKHMIDKPLCITAHGSDVRLLSQNPLCKDQIIRVLVASDAIISGHPEITGLVRHLGRDEVAEIPNGVDLEKFNPRISGDRIRKECNVREEHIISFIANLIPFKDPETFVRSVPLVLRERDDIRFLVVGDGPLRVSIENLSRALEVDEYVIFAGRRKDVNLILAASDIFVALSPVENIWSTTILESMAAGTPCIVTKAGTTERHLMHGETAYLIEKKNPKALAEAILHLLSNKEMCLKLAQNGRRLVQERFDIRQSGKQIRELYSHMLSRKIRTSSMRRRSHASDATRSKEAASKSEGQGYRNLGVLSFVTAFIRVFYGFGRWGFP